MPKILKNFSLLAYNTFGVDVNSRYFAEVTTEAQLQEIIASGIWQDNPLFILGGGSNVLFTRDVDGLIVKLSHKGIEKVYEDENNVHLKVAAGEAWDDFVNHAIADGYWGIENLIAIPGCVGAAPVQNIGAYGAEQKDTFVSCDVLELDSGRKLSIRCEACNFAYRDSIFKQTPGKYLVLSATYRLSKKPRPVLGYPALRDYLMSKSVNDSDIKEIGAAVAQIRNQKLPDVKLLGNAGSFFKNPWIEQHQYDMLKKKYPGIPGFQIEGGYKLAAAWLIDQAGWRGKRIKNVGVHNKQALVLVNYGGATGAEIKALSEDIVQSVEDIFGVSLQPEVLIY